MVKHTYGQTHTRHPCSHTGTTPPSSSSTPPLIHLHAYEALQGNQLLHHTLPATPYTYSDGTPLPPTALAATAVGSHTSTHLSLTAVLSFADGSMVAVDTRNIPTRPGGAGAAGAASGAVEVVWERDDGLASAQQVMFSDLPPASVDTAGGGAASGGGAGGVWEALGGDHARLQWLTLKTQLQIATPEDVALRAQLKQSTNDVRLPYRYVCGVAWCGVWV